MDLAESLAEACYHLGLCGICEEAADCERRITIERRRSAWDALSYEEQCARLDAWAADVCESSDEEVVSMTLEGVIGG